MASTRRGRASGGFASGEHRCVVRELARADATVLRVERTRGTQRRARRPPWHRAWELQTPARNERGKGTRRDSGQPEAFFCGNTATVRAKWAKTRRNSRGNWFSGYERMTRLALALACLLAGTLVSTRRGSATSAAAGANIGAASILCEAAMQADAISEQAKATAVRGCEEAARETLNSVPAEVWAHALKTLGKVGEANNEHGGQLDEG
ncbi:hypothetical protein ERJ75_000620000 [Trypanosoma vivax]|nr:hypothetical protein ERJ75_000620000 [Trypanosoma vivax]